MDRRATRTSCSSSRTGLGQAYIGRDEQTAQFELILRRVAAANGASHTRVVTFPTAVFMTLHDGERERVTLSEGPLEPLRHDAEQPFDAGRAIALGTLVGAALYQAVTEAFGWWQLQIGRALRRKG